jgi:hypothetical protein
MRFSPQLLGRAAAVVTVLIWTAFIVIARASADPALGAPLSPFDIALLRVLGASVVLLPWGCWLVKRDGGGWLRVSPLPMRPTVIVGFFGGLAAVTAGILIGVRAVVPSTPKNEAIHDRMALGNGVNSSKPSAVEA